MKMEASVFCLYTRDCGGSAPAGFRDWHFDAQTSVAPPSTTITWPVL